MSYWEKRLLPLEGKTVVVNTYEHREASRSHDNCCGYTGTLYRDGCMWYVEERDEEKHGAAFGKGDISQIIDSDWASNNQGVPVIVLNGYGMFIPGVYEHEKKGHWDERTVQSCCPMEYTGIKELIDICEQNIIHWEKLSGDWFEKPASRTWQTVHNANKWRELRHALKGTMSLLKQIEAVK